MLEFKPLTSGEVWQVEKFAELAAEFGFTPAAGWQRQMAQLHFHGSERTRPWLIVRRLYGVAPMVPSEGAHPDDLRAHTRAQLQEALGLESKELQAELDALKVHLSQRSQAEQRSPDPTPADESPASAVSVPGPGVELELDDRILARFQFSERMFQVPAFDPISKREVERTPGEVRQERDWFLGRVREWAKMLGDPMGGAMARATLINELYLLRLDTLLTQLNPTSAKYKEVQGLKQKTEATYQEQLDKLQKLFPAMGVADRTTAKGVISDLNVAHRDYYGHGNRRLMDQLHTAAELEFLTRTSAQLPTPRIRLGQNVYLLEAVHGLYDPEFRSQLSHRTLRALDAAAQAAVQKARESEPIVDLERGVEPGEGDDFEDYREP
jgi:hypothetical protein